MGNMGFRGVEGVHGLVGSVEWAARILQDPEEKKGDIQGGVFNKILPDEDIGNLVWVAFLSWQEGSGLDLSNYRQTKSALGRPAHPESGPLRPAESDKSRPANVQA